MWTERKSEDWEGKNTKKNVFEGKLVSLNLNDETCFHSCECKVVAFKHNMWQCSWEFLWISTRSMVFKDISKTMLSLSPCSETQITTWTKVSDNALPTLWISVNLFFSEMKKKNKKLIIEILILPYTSFLALRPMHSRGHESPNWKIIWV